MNIRSMIFEVEVKEVRMYREGHSAIRISARTDNNDLDIEWNEPVTVAAQYRVGAKVRVRIDVSLDHLSPEVTLTEWAELMLSRNTQTETLQRDARILSELGVPEPGTARAYVLFERHPPQITAMLTIEHHGKDEINGVTEWMQEKLINRRDVPLEGALLRTFRELAAAAHKDFNVENGDRYIELESDPDPAPPNPDDMLF